MLNNQIVFGLTCFVLGGILSPIVNIAKDAIMTWHFRRQHEEIEKDLEEFYDTHIRNDYASAHLFKEQSAGQRTPDPEADVSGIPEEYRAESDPQPEEEDEEERKKREGERGFFS